MPERRTFILGFHLRLFFISVIFTSIFYISCNPEQIPGKTSFSEIDELLEIADNFEGVNYDSSLFYSNEALELSRSQGDANDVVRSLNNVGYSLNELERPEEALDMHLEALNLSKSNNDDVNLSKTLNFLGVYYDRFSDYDKALEYFLESLKLREALNDTIGKAIVLGNIGLNYFRLNQYDLAEKYSKEALEIEWILNDTFYIANSLLNYALVLDKTGRDEEAIQMNEQSIELAKISNNAEALTTAMTNLGDIFAEQKSFEIAEDVMLNALEQRRHSNANYNLVWSHIHLADLYLEWGDLYNALLHSDSALYYNSTIHNKRSQEKILDSRVKIFKEMGDYESGFNYQNLLIEVKDTLNSERRLSKLAAMEAELNLLEKENKIIQLNNEKLISERKILILTICIILIAFLGWVGFLIVRRKMRRINLAYQDLYKDLQSALSEIQILNEEIEKRKNEEKNILDKYDLSFREIEVIELVSKGLTNKQVSDKLYISENTVKYHVKNIYHKLGISNRKSLRKMAS